MCEYIHADVIMNLGGTADVKRQKQERRTARTKQKIGKRRGTRNSQAQCLFSGTLKTKAAPLPLFTRCDICVFGLICGMKGLNANEGTHTHTHCNFIQASAH